MEFLEKVSRLLNQGLLWIAGCLLAVMIILTCGNIFCRVVWVPIRGTFELMGYLGAVITFFSMIGWEVAKYAGNLRSTGEVTETLRIIYYPFTYAVALGCFSLTLVFLVEVLRSFSGKQGESA